MMCTPGAGSRHLAPEFPGARCFVAGDMKGGVSLNVSCALTTLGTQKEMYKKAYNPYCDKRNHLTPPPPLYIWHLFTLVCLSQGNCLDEGDHQEKPTGLHGWIALQLDSISDDFFQT